MIDILRSFCQRFNSYNGFFPKVRSNFNEEKNYFTEFVKKIIKFQKIMPLFSIEEFFDI